MERIRKVKERMEIHLKDGRRGEMMRDGIYIAIVGPPNAGKSSLINRIGIMSCYCKEILILLTIKRIDRLPSFLPYRVFI